MVSTMEASSNDHHSTYTPLVGSSRPYGQNSESGEGIESSWNGEWVKSIVYAGLDAIVTSFSLISSISGGNLSSGMCLTYCSNKAHFS